jgi:hypothetical protein
MLFFWKICKEKETKIKIVLNLLKKDKGKESLRPKRLKAGWNNDFLLRLITN